MPPAIREVDLYAAVIRAFPNYHCFAEVPFFGKHVDLVFAPPSMSEFFAVEVKLKDWRSALRQASLNQLFATYSYAAFPARVADRLSKFGSHVFRETGVGIISISDAPTILVPAAESTFVFSGHRKRIRQTLQGSKTRSPKSLEVIQHAIAARKRSVEFLQNRAS